RRARRSPPLAARPVLTPAGAGNRLSDLRGAGDGRLRALGAGLGPRRSLLSDAGDLAPPLESVERGKPAARPGRRGAGRPARSRRGRGAGSVLRGAWDASIEPRR